MESAWIKVEEYVNNESASLCNKKMHTTSMLVKMPGALSSPRSNHNTFRAASAFITVCILLSTAPSPGPHVGPANCHRFNFIAMILLP